MNDVMFWHSVGTSVSWHAHFVDFAPRLPIFLYLSFFLPSSIEAFSGEC
jgi:hypothetical protein